MTIVIALIDLLKDLSQFLPLLVNKSKCLNREVYRNVFLQEVEMEGLRSGEV